MPTTKKGIRTPADSIKISQLGAAIRTMAEDVDDRLTVHNPYLGDNLPPHVDARVRFLERLAAQPGTLRVNEILDPEPLDAPANYIAGRANLQQAFTWGRMICNAAGATYLLPKTNGLESKGIEAPVGTPFALSVLVRAMPERDLRVALHAFGHTASAGTLGTQTNVATTGWVTVAAGQQKRLTLTGVMPAGTYTHLAPQLQMSRVGETYPAVGDFLYFRQFLAVTGTDPASPPSANYFNGDSANSYWEGEPHKSPSVTAAPRESGAGTDAGLDALRRDVIVDAGIKRRGGTIGTAGRAAIALRFDHHLPAFKSKVLPLLKEYRLPWGQMLNPARIADGSETMTYAQIAAECYGSGGEVWHHSYSHSGMTTAADADREVIRGFDDLTAGLPGLWIDGWAGPGQPDLMGMEGSDTPYKFWGTYPGRLVLARHAFVRGYYPGVYQALTGRNMVGGAHSTLDTVDAAYVGGLVRGAVASRSGLTLMLHPNYLDTAGYITTAALRTIFADLAARRDAGELLLLSPTGILLADASHDHRRNLLTTAATAGSTFSTWSETVTSRSAATQYGVPHELQVTVTARSAGTVSLNLKEAVTGPRFDITHSATLTEGQTATLRCLATFPRDSGAISASLSGNVDRSAIELHAL